MTLNNIISRVGLFWDDLSIFYSVTKVNKCWSCMIVNAPAATALDAGVFLPFISRQVLSKHRARPFVADTVTLWLLLPAWRSRSWSADRSKWESCPTNRDKYTLPLFPFTLVFPTLLEPPCCSKASSEEMTDHIKRLAVALTGVLAPAFRREGDALTFIRGLRVICVSFANVGSHSAAHPNKNDFTLISSHAWPIFTIFTPDAVKECH